MWLTPSDRLVYELQGMEPDFAWHDFAKLVGEQLPRLNHPNVRAGDVLDFLQDADARELANLMTPVEQRKLAQLPAYLKLFGCPNLTGSVLSWYQSADEARENAVESHRSASSNVWLTGLACF